MAFVYYKGIGSSDGPINCFFRQVSLDFEMKYKPTFVADGRSWDVETDYQRIIEKGCGPIRFVFITSPCNAWSAMRFKKGRPPISVDEQFMAKELIHSTVKHIKHLQSQLTKILPGAILKIFWETPSSANEKSLAAYMQQAGLLEALGLKCYETSWCAYGLAWSKPSNVMTNIEGYLPMPVCSHTSPFSYFFS